MRFYLSIAVLCCTALSVQGEFADYRYVPPAKSYVSPAKATEAMATTAIDLLRRGAIPLYPIADYAGQNAALKQASTHPELQVAVGATLEWNSGDLLDPPVKEAGRYVWRIAIRSADATALRLRVDLAGLGPADEIWTVDPEGRRALGPYGLANAEGDGLWLPTTMGDTTILAVYSPHSLTPAFTIRSLSHYYEEIIPKLTKGTNCPISVDCITDASLQEVSTGIGRMTVTDEGGSGALCSGALVNNAVTEDLERLFLTADHCFQDFPDTIFASGVEVIWDVRPNGCPGTEPSTQEIAGLPRSTGSAFLGNSTTLDGMLLSLASVPVGELGRAYLGWDTSSPRIGDDAVSLHHPAGRAMRESIGRVDNVNVDTNFGVSQTTLRWFDGITEGGSSGSPVMFDDGNFRVFGMLSNGNIQRCSNNNARLDQYSSFASFFAQIGGFLNSDTPPSAGRSFYTRNGSVGGGGDGDGALCMISERSVADAAGDIALAGLTVLTLLGIGTLERRRG